MQPRETERERERESYREKVASFVSLVSFSVLFFWGGQEGRWRGELDSDQLETCLRAFLLKMNEQAIFGGCLPFAIKINAKARLWRVFPLKSTTNILTIGGPIGGCFPVKLSSNHVRRCFHYEVNSQRVGGYFFPNSAANISEGVSLQNQRPTILRQRFQGGSCHQLYGLQVPWLWRGAVPAVPRGRQERMLHRSHADSFL